MNSLPRFWLLVTFITIVGTLCFPSGTIAAPSWDNTAVQSFAQYDINGDGRPDTAILAVNYLGYPFKVVVYDPVQDMQLSGDWWTGTDFVNDTWLFQNEAGDQTRLIIRFSHDTAGYQADLFDDVNNDGTVAFAIQNTDQINITESKFPTVRMTAQKPWILADDQINYIVQLKIYHPVNSILGVPIKYLPNDGRVALEQELVDSDQDGIPDYERGLSFPIAPSTWGFFRTGLNINIGKLPSSGFKGFFLWPYLGYAQAEDGTATSASRRPDDLSPPIHVDWQKGQIAEIAQFLPLWDAGDQWNLYATTPLVKEAVNVLDWERFANYAFSGSGTPDMIFHLMQGGLGETIGTGAQTLYPQQVSYSWHQRNLGSLRWDYKLEMAGMHKLPATVVAFKDFSLREVPFEKYLGEFLSQDWAYATFVVAEQDYFDTNEGIYEWGTLQGVINDAFLYFSTGSVDNPDSYIAQHDYLYGVADVSPAAYYTDIREGLRGEYADLNGPARLYFSPIDRKLHLLQAQKGVWNLGGGREIRTANLGGDHLNQWVLTQNGRPAKSLYAAAGCLVYQDAAGIQVIRAGVPEALFNTLPPRDKNEWVQLGQKLEADKPAFAPDDFAAMLHQFGQPSLSFTGATLSGFRLTSGGFRFVLELQPGFTAQGLELFQLQSSLPGQYAVTYDGQFSAAPLTPAHLTIDLRLPKGQQIKAGDLIPVQLAALNTGLEDAVSLKLFMQAENGDETIEIGARQMDLFSNQAFQTSFDWQPVHSGSWKLRAWLEDVDGKRLAEISSPVSVSETRQNRVISITSDAGRLLPAFFVLLASAGLMGAAFMLGIRSSRS
jgi:hypothetical protein